jgi:transposase-like protein
MHTQVIPDVKKATLRGIINQTVERGSIVSTDELNSYNLLKGDGYTHGASSARAKDGRKLIKVLRRGVGADRWRLDTHNAKAEEDVELIGAWRYLGVLPARHEGAEAAARVRAFPRRRRGS